MDGTLINSPVDDYASLRESIVATEYSPQLQQLPDSWSRSRHLHQLCRDALHSLDLTSSVQTVAVSGSLGRMEVVDGSDCDLIVVLNDDAIDDSSLAEKCFDTILKAIKPSGLATSKSGGIFSVPTSRERLCDAKSLGVIDEDMATFGHRIQLLIDSQPIFADGTFHDLQRAILERYATATIRIDNRKQWTYLLNDLIRYHRSLSVRTQWATRDTPAKWRILNLKFFHSRMMNYLGLLVLLGECSSQTSNKVDWLLNHLKLTPLERVVHVLQIHDVGLAHQIADRYDRFLAAMNSPDFLASLEIDGPAGPPDEHADYNELRTSSREIVSILARFVFKSAEWDPRFMELMLF